MACEDRTSRTVGQLTFLGHVLLLILKLMNCSSRLQSICQFTGLIVFIYILYYYVIINKGYINMYLTKAGQSIETPENTVDLCYVMQGTEYFMS
jgi:hypothetical protein